MNDLEIYKNEEFGEIRTVQLNNEPMFCLMDICKALEMSNPTMVASRLEEDEVTKFNLGGQTGETNFVTESGLYAVVLRSDKPNAKKFRKWVTSEVLPSIRKTGAYKIKQLSPQLQLMQGLLDQMAEQEHRLLNVEATVSNVKEVLTAPIGDWREEINQKIRSIANASGIDYRALYVEMYEELEKRAGCDLSRLSSNKRSRLEELGKTKTYIEKECSKIAVIADNKRLKEIFTSIVKEFLIKYVA